MVVCLAHRRRYQNAGKQHRHGSIRKLSTPEKNASVTMEETIQSKENGASDENDNI